MKESRLEFLTPSYHSFQQAPWYWVNFLARQGNGGSVGVGRTRGTEACLACCGGRGRRENRRRIPPVVSPLLGGSRRRRHREESDKQGRQECGGP